MESWSPVTPLLLRNLITSLFILADTSISSLAQKHKTLQLLRYVFVSSSLFFLRFLLSLNPSTTPTENNESSSSCGTSHHEYMPAPIADDGDTAIARTLSQLLSLVSDIPVSSRKYQLVRCLAENVILDNQREGVEALRHVNRTVLSAAFSTTLSQLEAAAAFQQQQQQQHHSGDGDIGVLDTTGHRHHWVMRAVRSVADVVWTKRVSCSGGSRSSAEKLAAELLWLAETMASCGFAEEAVRRWASASILARLSLSAQPRLQASLVKLSALLLKYAKDMGENEGINDDNESKQEQQKRKEAKMQMQLLMLWIPLLCIASNGTDVPVLSTGERAELERVMEETINLLEEEDQEGVLSLWLHHFTYCSSSDWPNLHASYARWCNASRKPFLVHNS